MAPTISYNIVYNDLKSMGYKPAEIKNDEFLAALALKLIESDKTIKAGKKR